MGGKHENREGHYKRMYLIHERDLENVNGSSQESNVNEEKVSETSKMLNKKYNSILDSQLLKLQISPEGNYTDDILRLQHKMQAVLKDKTLSKNKRAMLYKVLRTKYLNALNKLRRLRVSRTLQRLSLMPPMSSEYDTASNLTQSEQDGEEDDDEEEGGDEYESALEEEVDEDEEKVPH